MKKIFKYRFDVAHEVTIAMHEGAEILSLQVQDDKPTIWAMVYESDEVFNRHFLFFGTGHEVNQCMNLGYIGTIQLSGFVWHLFEKY